MRCLLYHLCAKRLNDHQLNYVHAQKRIDENAQKKYDLILINPITKCKTAIELKCWLWKSSGLNKKAEDIIKDQLQRLKGAVESKEYDLAYLLFLDEFRILNGRWMNFQIKEGNLHFGYFMPTCGKTSLEEKWMFNEKAIECLNCSIQMQCQKSQNDLKRFRKYMQH